MSYISIAEHYARGDITTAVNGYWSPAVSWLMAPFIFFGIDGRMAFALVNGLASVLIIILGSLIVWVHTSRNYVATIFYLIAVTIFLQNAVYWFFPDLLLVAWAIVFTCALIYANRLYGLHTKNNDLGTGALLGFIGTIGFMVKMYAVPFFVTTIILWTIVRIIFDHKESDMNVVSKKSFIKYLRMPIIIMMSMLVFSAPWVTALSLKYGYFTFGSSLAINTSPKFDQPKVSNPATETTKEVGQSQDISNNTPSQIPDGLSENVSEKPVKISSPPYETATTSTEDRTPKKPSNNLPAVGGSSGLANFIEGRKIGIPAYIKSIYSMWSIIFFVLLFVAGWLIAKRQSYDTAPHYYLVGMSFLVYFSGYAMLASEGGGNLRYYWPLMVYALLLLSIVIGDLLRAGKLGKISAITIASIAVITLVVDYPVTRSLEVDTPQKSVLEKIADDFEAKYPVEEYDDYLSNNGRRNREFAFFIDGQAHGSLGAGHEFTDLRLRETMEAKDIDYFLHFTPEDSIEFDPSEFDGELLEVYELGESFSGCEDRRSSRATSCTLYILRPIY